MNMALLLQVWPYGAEEPMVPTDEIDNLICAEFIEGKQVHTADRCIQQTGAYSRQVHTADRCIQQTGAYSRQVHKTNRCIQQSGTYSRQVHTADGCI